MFSDCIECAPLMCSSAVSLSVVGISASCLLFMPCRPI